MNATRLSWRSPRRRAPTSARAAGLARSLRKTSARLDRDCRRVVSLRAAGTTRRWAVLSRNGTSDAKRAWPMWMKEKTETPTMRTLSARRVWKRRGDLHWTDGEAGGEQRTRREGMKRIALHSLAARHLDRAGIRFTAMLRSRLRPRRHESRLLYIRSNSQGRHCLRLGGRRCDCCGSRRRRNARCWRDARRYR